MNLLRSREIRRLNPRNHRPSNFKSETQRVAYWNVIEAIQSGDLQLIEVNCPVCDYNEFQHVASVDRQGLPVQTVRCERCPTLYSRWRFNDTSLTEFYSRYYRELYVGDSNPDREWFSLQTESGRKTLKKLQDAEIIPSSLEGFRVMEVGTAAGGGLVPFRDAGASVLGIDFDENYLNFGRSMGIDLRLGGVNELNEFGSQDVVILKDVLEHLPTPIHSLKVIHSVLSDRGVVYIQVPGLQALKFLGYRNDLLRYFQIAHLCHYTRESLNYSCQRAGLKVVHSEPQGVVVCKKAPLVSGSSTTVVPSPDPAIDALEHIYRHRLITSLDHWLRARIPPKAKQFGKRFIR